MLPVKSARYSLLVLAVVLLTGVAAVAQSAPAPQAPKPAASPAPVKLGPFTLTGNMRFRVEAWDWFDGTAADAYGFPHWVLRLGIGQQTKNLDWQVEIEQPTVLGLPDDAIAPGAQGQMGLGATYFAANGRRQNTAALNLSKAFVRFKGFGHEANRLTLGRFEFIEGAEVAPKDKTLAALKSMRIAQRLIGNFGFPVHGRAADGVNVSLHGRFGNLTLAAARPTRGVFQTDGLGELDIGYVYGAYTRAVGGSKSAGELRVFGIGYDDERRTVKTDSRPLPVRQGADTVENIQVGTIGAHYIHAVHTQRAGKFDLLLWGAAQFGSWGLLDHRAGAVAVEAGWQPEVKTLKPWLRLGYFHGSGDGDPNDGEHKTFFQMLPTARWYARFPFYNLQNNEDFSATLILRPTPKLTLRTEGHALRLSARNDLWYQGGGAFQPRTFGYVGRPSGGHRGLGNLWDVSADYQVTPRFGVGLYFANVWGKGVMESVYPAGSNARFGYSEVTYKF